MGLFTSHHITSPRLAPSHGPLFQSPSLCSKIQSIHFAVQDTVSFFIVSAPGFHPHKIKLFFLKQMVIPSLITIMVHLTRHCCFSLKSKMNFPLCFLKSLFLHHKNYTSTYQNHDTLCTVQCFWFLVGTMSYNVLPIYSELLILVHKFYSIYLQY